MIEIIGKDGKIKSVKIYSFSAMDGWDIQRKFFEFASTTSKEARLAYIMEVLSYAKVIVGNNELPLKTSALIDNHLENWKNIETVFEAVLIHNEIDPKTHAEKPSYWAAAGAEMAVSFIAEATKLMGPAFELVAKANQE
jgi:hypothetical protein